jgi:hypothetical protein
LCQILAVATVPNPAADTLFFPRLLAAFALSEVGCAGSASALLPKSAHSGPRIGFTPRRKLLLVHTIWADRPQLEPLSFADGETKAFTQLLAGRLAFAQWGAMDVLDQRIYFTLLHPGRP